MSLVCTKNVVLAAPTNVTADAEVDILLEQRTGERLVQLLLSRWSDDWVGRLETSSA